MKQRKFRELLRKYGYELVRSKGGHITYKRNGDDKLITIPAHKDINPMLAQRLIKEIKAKGKS